MLVRYNNGKQLILTVAVQSRFSQGIQDETAPPPVSRKPISDADSLDTQPVYELVRAVLDSKFKRPYPEDIIDQVPMGGFHPIKNSPGGRGPRAVLDWHTQVKEFTMLTSWRALWHPERALYPIGQGEGGEHTMITWENSIFINRPRQEVWDFVSNPANTIQWEDSFSEWTSEGPHGVGSTSRGVSKILGREIEFPIVVTAWDPPNELGRKSVGGPIQAESTVKFEPREGGTQLSVRYQGEARGFFKIAEGLLRKQLEKQTTANYNALKLLLEADQA